MQNNTCNYAGFTPKKIGHLWERKSNKKYTLNSTISSVEHVSLAINEIIRHTYMQLIPNKVEE